LDLEHQKKLFMSVSHAASLRYQFLFFSVDFAGEGVNVEDVIELLCS
jgi:hypothetical protein